MKFALAVLCLVALAVTCPAQDLPTGIAGGLSYQPGGNPALAGTGMYWRTVNDVPAFVVVDAIPASVRPFAVTNNMAVGVAPKVVTLPIAGRKIPVYTPIAAGFSWSGANAGWAWNPPGALASIPVSGGWCIQPNVRFVKSSINNNSGYQVIGGVMFAYGWGR